MWPGPDVAGPDAASRGQPGLDVPSQGRACTMYDIMIRLFREHVGVPTSISLAVTCNNVTRSRLMF